MTPRPYQLNTNIWTRPLSITWIRTDSKTVPRLALTISAAITLALYPLWGYEMSYPEWVLMFPVTMKPAVSPKTQLQAKAVPSSAPSDCQSVAVMRSANMAMFCPSLVPTSGEPDLMDQLLAIDPPMRYGFKNYDEPQMEWPSTEESWSAVQEEAQTQRWQILQTSDPYLNEPPEPLY